MGKGFNDSFDIDFDNDWASNMKPKLSGSKKAFNYISSSRKAIVGLFSVILIILMVLGYTNLMTSKNFREASETAYTPAYKVRYQELGSQVISNYFAGLPPTVPLSSDVSWSGGTMPDEDETSAADLQSVMASKGSNAPEITGITFIKGEQNELPLTQAASLSNPEDFSDSYQETLTYYITMNGHPMEATISFLTPNRDADALPILLSAPTVTPYTVNSDPQNVTDNPMGDPNMVEAKVNSEGLDNVVGRFTKAYAKNDQNVLQQLTQDSQGRKFVGIGGFEASNNHQVLWAYNDSTIEDSRDKAVVRIRFTMTQTVKGEEEGSESTFDVDQEMDLLVHNVRSNLPAIVSWGPAGSWRSLEPFSVARENEHREQGDIEEEEQSSSSNDLDSGSSDDDDESSTTSTTSTTTEKTTSRNNDLDSNSSNSNSGESTSSGNSGGSGNMEMDAETCKLLGLDC